MTSTNILLDITALVISFVKFTMNKMYSEGYDSILQIHLRHNVILNQPYS